MEPIKISLGISEEEFLKKYWQKKPLLVKSAAPRFKTLIDADDLAGLACEEKVESRIVLEKDGSEPWQLLKGPVNEDSFSKLPESHWSLLVQDVDKFIPEVFLSKQAFRFIPDWRIDDCMISYSPDQGSVGPHLDYYDVFLLQGLGRKKWRIEKDCRSIENSSYFKDYDLKILREFKTDQEYILEQGDMLYLPPGLAHHGVSLGESMTYSYGFRSPSKADILARFLEESLASSCESERYSDPDLNIQNHPGEISEQAIDKLIETIKNTPIDRESIKHWFGRMATEHKGSNPERFMPNPPDKKEDFLSFQKKSESSLLLRRDEAAELAYTQSKTGEYLFFVNGSEYILDKSMKTLVEQMTDHYILPTKVLLSTCNNDSQMDLLLKLINEGIFYWEE